MEPTSQAGEAWELADGRYKESWIGGSTHDECVGVVQTVVDFL